MTTEELKPCPFCGGQPEIVTRNVEPQGDPWYGRKDETFVLCGCGACLFDGGFHEGFWNAETRAIAAWNTRAALQAGDAATGEPGEVIEGHSTSACGPDRSADARDAARYRWLRAGDMRHLGEVIPNRGAREILEDNMMRAKLEFRFWCSREELDAAIDAAMGTVSPDRPMSDGKEPQ